MPRLGTTKYENQVRCTFAQARVCPNRDTRLYAIPAS
jgi:hypothetical protein